MALTRGSKGDGWGGPARGSGSGPATPFAPGNKAAVGRGKVDKLKLQAKEDRQKALTDHLYELALTAAREETQLSATVAALDRIEGKPVQRNVNVNTEDVSKLSDAELEKIVRAGMMTAEAPRDGEVVN